MVKRPVILLVDDTPMFLEVERGFLKETPGSVVTAANGAEALDIVRTLRPDLVYMDLHMPEMDGAACCSLLRDDPQFTELPIVMLIAAGKDQDRIICREAGCSAVITKPIDRREFLDVGRRFLPAVDRREKRHTCKSLVVFRTHRETYYGSCEDINAHGMYIASKICPAHNEQVKLSFTLPNSSDTLYEITGRTAWVNAPEKRVKATMPAGFGVEFKRMPPEVEYSLKQYVEEKFAA